MAHPRMKIWYLNRLQGSRYYCKMGYPRNIKIVTQSQDAMIQVGAGRGGAGSQIDLYSDLHGTRQTVLTSNFGRGATSTTISHGLQGGLKNREAPVEWIDPAVTTTLETRGTSGDHPRRPPSKSSQNGKVQAQRIFWGYFHRVKMSGSDRIENQRKGCPFTFVQYDVHLGKGSSSRAPTCRGDLTGKGK